METETDSVSDRDSDIYSERKIVRHIESNRKRDGQSEKRRWRDSNKKRIETLEQRCYNSSSISEV